MTVSQRISRAALALAAIALGITLVLHPFPSIPWLAAALAVALIVAGVLDLLDHETRQSALRLAVAAVLPIVGLVLLAWRGLSIFGIAVAAAVAMAAWGVSRWVRAARGERAWWVDVLFGAAAVAAAILAVSWPGVSIFLTVQAVGIALLWRGGVELVRIARNRPNTHDDATSSPARTVLRTVAAVAAVAITVPLAVATFVVRGAAPVPGAFYDADLAANTAPGTLLKAEPSTQGTPDGARAWRILYSTMRGTTPALASGMVLIPNSPPAQPGPRPVIAWAHGTSGVAENCAPSMMPEPFAHIPGLAQVIDKGWALVATDYIGMGTRGPSPYVIGEGEGRSVLDSVRAARQLPNLNLSKQTVVWGHSQGGHAALWTELLAPTYAPDVGVIATAAQAPASDLNSLALNMESMAGGSLLASYVLESYSRAYSDVSYADYLKVQARLPVRGMASRCLASKAMPVSLAEALFLGKGFYSTSPTSGPLGRRLTENTPSGKLPYPTLISQGLTDQVINPDSQNAFTAAQCTVGSNLEYLTYPGLGHMTLIEGDSPAVPYLLSWTQARFDGAPPTPNCPAPH